MIRRPTAVLFAAVLFALVAGSCGSDRQTVAWDAPDQPVRGDLGVLAPPDEENQRLFNDVTATLNMPDGDRYTIEAEQFWVVMDAPLDGPTDRQDDPLSYFELQQTLGRDDADLVPALSRLAAMVGYEFDEAAAEEWVNSNDDGFSLEVKPLLPDRYGVYLNVDDGLNNTASVFIYFPAESESISGSPPVEAADDPLFDGRLIGG